jgi:hypothetical protein
MPLAKFSATHQPHNSNKMGDVAANDVKFTRKRYLNGPDSTKLHTVDIWQPDSESIAGEDGKLWLMFVNTPHFPKNC